MLRRLQLVCFYFYTSNGDMKLNHTATYCMPDGSLDEQGRRRAPLLVFACDKVSLETRLAAVNLITGCSVSF